MRSLQAVLVTGLSAGLVVGSFGCQSEEAPRVELPVVVDGSGLQPAANDLGWTVEFSHAQIVVADLQLTTAGELHSAERVEGGLGELLISTAHAHPGHNQGGEIIGELPGTRVIDFVNDEGRELGLATLIVGEYTAANFGLGRADATTLAGTESASAELLGHTALLRGTATRTLDAETVEITFSVLIDSPPEREIVGVPFAASVTETSSFSIGFALLSVDPQEGDGLFDGIDFAALDQADGAEDGLVTLVDPEAAGAEHPAALADAYYELRREFQTHDLFELRPR